MDGTAGLQVSTPANREPCPQSWLVSLHPGIPGLSGLQEPELFLSPAPSRPLWLFLVLSVLPLLKRTEVVRAQE